MTFNEEAQRVFNNLNGDTQKIAEYIVNRCGDFIFDDERANFIAAFLVAAPGHVIGKDGRALTSIEVDAFLATQPEVGDPAKLERIRAQFLKLKAEADAIEAACRCDCVNCVTGNHGDCYYRPSICPWFKSEPKPREDEAPR
jgi:hypothetical protein